MRQLISVLILGMILALGAGTASAREGAFAERTQAAWSDADRGSLMFVDDDDDDVRPSRRWRGRSGYRRCYQRGHTYVCRRDWRRKRSTGHSRRWRNDDDDDDDD